MPKLISITFICLLLVGCSTFHKDPVVLTMEDRIFTLPKGKPAELILDKEPIKITFTTDMKVVSPSLLIKQEELLNKETLKKIGAKKSRNKWVSILGSLLAIVSGIFTYLKKKKK